MLSPLQNSSRPVGIFLKHRLKKLRTNLHLEVPFQRPLNQKILRPILQKAVLAACPLQVSPHPKAVAKPVLRMPERYQKPPMANTNEHACVMVRNETALPRTLLRLDD